MRRLGFSSGFQVVNVGNDGRVYLPTDSGELQYLETAAPQDAAHDNPGFEAVSGGVPDDWDFSWYVGTPTIAAEDSLVYSGGGALRISLAAASDHQYALSSVFDVPSGGVVDFSAFGISTLGSPTIKLGLLTRTSGTPLFLDEPDSMGNERADAVAIPTDWAKFQRRVNVPAGHTRARVYFKVEPSAGEAVDVVLDLTSSVVLPGVEFVSAWDGIPLVAGFGDVTDWAPAEFRRRGDDDEFRGLSAWTGGSPVAAGSVITATPLPEGFRPAYNKVIADSYIPPPPAVASVGTTVYLRPDGHMVATAAIPVNATLNFDGKRIDLTT